MKKSYPHNVLGTKVCTTKGCTKRLKKRIEEEHPNIHKCFEHHKESERKRGHQMKL